MDPKALYVQLHRLVETMPELRGDITNDVRQWLGRASVLVRAAGNVGDSAAFDVAMDGVCSEVSISRQEQAVSRVQSILFRALAIAESDAPVEDQGTFIAAGNPLDAIAAVTKVIQQAAHSILVVDPYLNDKILLEFMPMAKEKVSIRLLADAQGVKPSLKPVADRWIAQYGANRPLEARITTPRKLHDRLIILDDLTVYILTQSFNALAERAPASLAKFETEAAGLKIEAYKELWDEAQPL